MSSVPGAWAAGPGTNCCPLTSPAGCWLSVRPAHCGPSTWSSDPHLARPRPTRSTPARQLGERLPGEDALGPGAGRVASSSTPGEKDDLRGDAELWATGDRTGQLLNLNPGIEPPAPSQGVSEAPASRGSRPALTRHLPTLPSLAAGPQSIPRMGRHLPPCPGPAQPLGASCLPLPALDGGTRLAAGAQPGLRQENAPLSPPPWQNPHKVPEKEGGGSGSGPAGCAGTPTVTSCCMESLTYSMVGAGLCTGRGAGAPRGEAWVWVAGGAGQSGGCPAGWTPGRGSVARGAGARGAAGHVGCLLAFPPSPSP